MGSEPRSEARAGEAARLAEIEGQWGASTYWVTSVSAARVRHMISVRRLRGRLISNDLFADPAWDILLEAFAGYLDETPCSLSDLSTASGVPESTALRWIDKLLSDALIEKAQGQSGRSEHYQLTSDGYLVMRNYLETVGLPI